MNLIKSDFIQRRIQYVDHVILDDEIAVDLEKIEAIMDWTTPKNVMDVGYFMGLERYYRSFNEGFSKITHLI